MPAAAIPTRVPPTLVAEYKERIVPALIKSRGYKNVMEVPKVQKVVVNCCIGSSVDTKVALEDAFNEVQMITGQRPIKTKSTQSIANFKLREGQEIGVKVTLRGAIMYEFLERLIRTALPRIRDFRGVSPRAFDGRGNYTLGVKDQTILPEVELDKVKRNLGMDITIVTTARKNDEDKELLALFGMPFSDRKLTPQ